ncbi:MAG: glycosyltransferase family 39 protein [Bryobacterales bacterium]|nr:glycosyltransferase family 39 protein [Bryobacterales bacterium]
MPGWVRIALVFFASFAILSYQVWRTPLADGYVDTVGRIAAQDEALYSHIALRMASDGEWLTPKFLGRLALFKPPLLYWASAASVRFFGNPVFALRLPSLLAGAAVAALLFAILGGWPGAVGVLLLLGDPLWHTLSRLALTDALLAAFSVAALHGVTRSLMPQFAVCTAGAILTKGIAGLIPMVALVLWWLLSPGASRWPIRKLARWLASPLPAVMLWVGTQLWLHPRWFWTEFVEVEILGYSLGAPPQTSAENPLLFYLKRIALTDALLLAVLAGAILRKWRDPSARIWLALVAAVIVAVAGNQYRNIAYVLPAIPALCLLGGSLAGRHARAVSLPLGLILVFRATQPAEPWGLRYQPLHNVTVRPALERYAQLERTKDLLIVDSEDEFAATTLGLRQVRYVYFGGLEGYQRYGLDFRQLGIVVTLEEWKDLKARLPVYRQRLREWGLDSTEPVATVILLRDATELPELLRASPHADFLLRQRTTSPSHELRELEGGRVFLYAQ